jgi:flagellar motor protein MotB
MAGKGGGGAWKVAYADFVTAMMAFFLVMWLCAQNSEVKRAVAEWFSDPLGSPDGGPEKKASRTGAMTEHISTGTVPLQEKVAMGQGRRSYSPLRMHSPATKLIRDWLHEDKQARQYWNKQVRDQLEAARWSKEVKDKKAAVADVAIRKLAVQLKEEIVREAPAKTTGVYRDLLLDAFAEVHWTEIAEDLIGQN